MKCEDKTIITSLTVAKAISCKCNLQELAVLAAFFSSLAANLSVIIQCRGLEAAQQEQCEKIRLGDDTQTINLSREVKDALRAQIPTITELLP